ncbi:MAG: PQQ-binding-like beta-propeller repeat protein [Planctomycetota bacterium]|nr:PQQ-binding-like beta-propeller repeat protein [Planctomycetota bacterium]
MRTTLPLLLLLPSFAYASDWSNSGGNPGRNGLTPEVGPEAATQIWSGSRSSIIAWQPVIEGSRVFMVRQTGFPPEQTASPVVCQDLDTGAELWATSIPANAGDWTTWVAGVKDGRVYASRSGNGASVSAKLFCLDAATGAVLWQSVENQNGGAYDGVVFAPNGDPVIAAFTRIWRFDHLTGATVWSTPRVGSVSGDCGGAIHGGAIYVADVVAGGHTIKRFDLATGAFQYQGPTMAGFTIQTTPMVAPNGNIYLSRVQNNVSVDFFYAFQDTGTAIVNLWNRPAGYSYAGEFGVGPDGSVYHLNPSSAIDRLDPATGATLNTTGALVADTWAPRIGVDGLGRVFLSNGGFTNGRFWSFNADLSLRWTVPVANVNIGAPAIGRSGTLIVAGIGANVTAYRTTPAFQSSFCFGDGSGTACPCGNNGAVGNGCANSVNAAGARLAASGAASLSNDTLLLAGTGMPNSSALYFQGTTQVSSAFGDGLRCAGGSVVRLATKPNAAGASQYPAPGDPTISVRGLVPSSGSQRTYQVWYRNAAAFCTASTFNLSNGVAITWQI